MGARFRDINLMVLARQREWRRARPARAVIIVLELVEVPSYITQ